MLAVSYTHLDVYKRQTTYTLYVCARARARVYFYVRIQIKEKRGE